ncbi:MAG: lysophospholipase [Myxococcota bacterium]
MRDQVTSTHAHSGETFHLCGWPSPVPTDTVLVVHHGLGEHSGRYDTLARQLETLPAHIWSFDLRGHGRSTGKRGHADGLEQLADDFTALIPVLMERAGASKLVIYGHSLGAAAVGWTLTTRPAPPALTALMLSAPPVFIAKNLGMRVKAIAGRVLVKLSPSLTLGNEIPLTAISSDPSEVERYRTDPRVHDKLSVRLGLSLLDDAPKIVERAARITAPTLLWHGTDDPIIDIRGTRALFAGLGSSDKALFELAGYRHEAHHERPDLAAKLFERVRAWLEPRVAPSGAEPRSAAT